MSECPTSSEGSATLVDRRDLLAAGASLLVTWPLGGLAAGTKATLTQLPMADPEFRLAARRGELCSTANATGIGLRGEYFSLAFGRGKLLLTRTDSAIDFDRGFEWPSGQTSQRPESVRWTGWVKPSLAGRYRFHVDQPYVRLVVARQTMLGEDARDAEFVIELASGRFYPVTLQIDHISSMKGRLSLEWTAPHGARYLIPRALLFLPSERVASKP